MELRSLRDDIEITRKSLEIHRDCFIEVRYYAYKDILQTIWDHFTKLGYKAKRHFWLNYHLAGNVATYMPNNLNDTRCKILPAILPYDDKIWFIGADSKNQGPKYWLYEATVESVVRILDEMHRFDFYIVNKKYRWLVTEEHHGMLLAVGEPVVSRLKKYSAK